MSFSMVQVLITLVLAVVGVSALGINGGEIPPLAFAIPALWLLPKGRAAAWLLLFALALYAMVLPYQPLALSISVWTLLPLFMVVYSYKSSKEVVAMLTAVILAMEAGIIALQYEGNLDGKPLYTIIQIVAVIMVWFSARSWRKIDGNLWLPLLVVIPLWMAGMAHAALAMLCVTGIIVSLQSIANSKDVKWSSSLSWLLPVVAFATFVVTPQYEVPNPVLISWFMILISGWATDFMMYVDEGEDE